MTNENFVTVTQCDNNTRKAIRKKYKVSCAQQKNGKRTLTKIAQ